MPFFWLGRLDGVKEVEHLRSTPPRALLRQDFRNLSSINRPFPPQLKPRHDQKAAH